MARRKLTNVKHGIKRRYAGYGGTLKENIAYQRYNQNFGSIPPLERAKYNIPAPLHERRKGHTD